MEKPSELAKWFFLFLQTERAMLMRIEFLVVVIALLYLLLFILDFRRRRSRSSTIKYILLILDAIADSTFLYTMGLMQSVPFTKDLFPVWAVVLVNLRFGGCFISAYGIPDQENRRMNELSNVMALSSVAVINGTRHSKFKHPIWTMWALQVIRSGYLIVAYRLAIRSSLHGRSSAYVTVGTRSSSNHGDHLPTEPEVDSTTMAGYDHPVCGDQKHKFEVEPPMYNFDHNTDQSMLITLETIWKPRGTLDNLRGHGDNDIKLIKDMCLSFSLYRLLRCRFDNLSLPSDRVDKIRKLMSVIMENGDGWKRTFRVIESELAFLNDYLYTTYPVLFFRGFPILGALHPVATIAVTCWLGQDIHRIYKANAGETAHIIHGVNVDLIITWVFMGVIVLKELWKMVTYALSDWTKVTVLCLGIAKSSVWLRKCLGKYLVWICTPRFKIVHRWHRKIDQYEFLKSYVYDPWKWNLLYYFSLGMVPKADDGVKLGKAIPLPEEVKAAIVKSISSLDLEEDRLKEDDIPSLMPDAIGSPFYWAFKLPTCAHTILVWHIATSMCEIELAQHYNTSLTDSEVLRALKSATSCFSSHQPFIIKVQRLERALRTNYSVANSISRYCAYLIASVPGLLPDSSFVPELVLKSTIAEASRILDGCDTLQSIYRRLMREGERKGDTADDQPTGKSVVHCFCSGNDAAQGENGEGGNRSADHQNQSGGNGDDMDAEQYDRITTMGAWLGRSLIETIGNDDARWKFLANVWADLLVHMAPSWNIDGHRKCLATGGEFITHVWAILSHCGVQGTKLWQQQEVAEDGHAANQHPEATGGNDQDPVQRASLNDTSSLRNRCSIKSKTSMDRINTVHDVFVEF
ncbi:hypothetical protein U9M48_009216 [Paspalum notatum var. saurae]|uniref:DUF4220 domain-containing protein n=1 Tax=Paspalum notatum var. saurae TaxID=547442 RepID=A0AAQ3WEV2_PASNO